METMKNSHKGQTVIETALMILLLFILFFGIAEIARFWWLKNQVNNAARVGVRVAIVDPSLTFDQSDVPIGTCTVCNGTDSTNSIVNAACSAITNGGLCAGAVVRLTVQGADANGAPGGTNYIPGGIIKVQIIGPPVATIVPGLAWLSLGLIPVNPVTNTITLSSDSTMRHE
jgi:hypothetical protein